MRVPAGCYFQRVPVETPAANSPGLPPAARLPVLDAVRGLAICLVLAAHFTPDYVMSNRLLEWGKKLMYTGWTGVDLFFVLSGFLITDILLRVRETPHWVRNFYFRRALRILPLYFFFLVLVFVILPWFVPPGRDPAYDIVQSFQGWYWIHCANVIPVLHGFAATMSGTASLAHFWSLAVEEHFYLLWPFLVARLPERRLLPVLLAVIGLALGLRVLAMATLQEPFLTGAYVQTPTRMDGLAFGALLTLLFRRVPTARLRKWALVILPLTGAVLLGDLYKEVGLWPSSTFMRSIGFTTVGLLYASLMVMLLTSAPTSPTRRLIDNAVLRFFGKYSYGIYVLHGLLVPMIDRWLPQDQLLARLHSPIAATLVCLAVKTGVAILLALLSWHLLEAPFLRLKDRFDYSAKAATARGASSGSP